MAGDGEETYSPLHLTRDRRTARDSLTERTILSVTGVRRRTFNRCVGTDVTQTHTQWNII